MVNLFSTIALILSLGGQILLFGKNRLVFPLWILSNVCWIMVNIIDTFNLQQVIMYIIYTIINVFSWFSWKNKTIDASVEKVKV